MRSVVAPRADLTTGVVDVWRAWLDVSDEDWLALASLLDEDERRRAARLRRPEHRRRFEVSHGVLRRILGAYLGEDPRSLSIRYECPRCGGAHGRPVVEVDGFHFSLSHSAGVALVAIAASPVGVDVERVRTGTSVCGIAERFFSTAERRALACTSSSELPGAFARCWTRKEAYVKMTGRGIFEGLGYFSVSIEEDEATVEDPTVPGGAATTSLFDLRVAPGFAGAVAVDQRGVTLRAMAIEGTTWLP